MVQEEYPAAQGKYPGIIPKDNGTGNWSVCVDLLNGGGSLWYDWVSTQRPVLSPNLEAALSKIKVLPHVK